MLPLSVPHLFPDFSMREVAPADHRVQQESVPMTIDALRDASVYSDH
jgi:hypothetical protein